MKPTWGLVGLVLVIGVEFAVFSAFDRRLNNPTIEQAEADLAIAQDAIAADKNAITVRRLIAAEYRLESARNKERSICAAE